MRIIERESPLNKFHLPSNFGSFPRESLCPICVLSTRPSSLSFLVSGTILNQMNWLAQPKQRGHDLIMVTWTLVPVFDGNWGANLTSSFYSESNVSKMVRFPRPFVVLPHSLNHPPCPWFLLPSLLLWFLRARRALNWIALAWCKPLYQTRPEHCILDIVLFCSPNKFSF